LGDRLGSLGFLSPEISLSIGGPLNALMELQNANDLKIHQLSRDSTGWILF
jgi:hypothetical protein